MTRKEAIAGHRMMWNEIADMIECGIEFSNHMSYKIQALEHMGEQRELISYCYCCEYAQKGCEYCPVKWNGEYEDPESWCFNRNEHSTGEYLDFVKAVACKKYEEAAIIARKIANLPERVVE